MKKVLLITVLIAAVLLAGCGQKKEVKPVIDGLVCDINVKYNGLQIAGVLTKPKDGTCKIKLSKPEQLDGITMNFTPDGVKLSYMGLQYTLPANSLPDTSFGQILVNTLNSANKALAAKSSGSNTVLSGISEMGTYELTIDKNKKPVKIKIPSINMEADFSGYK